MSNYLPKNKTRITGNSTLVVEIIGRLGEIGFFHKVSAKKCELTEVFCLIFS